MAWIEDQLALMTRLETAAAEPLAELLTTAARSTLAEFLQTRLIAQPDPRSIPALKKELRKIWLSSIEGMAGLFAAEFADGFPAQQKSFATDLLETFAGQLRPQTAEQILNTTQSQIRDLISGGLAGGEAADLVYSDLLRKLPDYSFIRALLISRTEIHAATQFASWQMARRSLVRLDKVWHTVLDERTRDFSRSSEFSHRQMHDVRRPLTEYFSVPRLGGGAEQLMFPGDPTGSAGNVINCRCIQTYVRASA